MHKSSTIESNGLGGEGSPGKLVLADGHTWHGKRFGADRQVRGEVVFHTGMTGYVEALTDPSYRGQILALTYPLQGNYGVPSGPFESDRVQVQGLLVAHYTAEPSHYAAVRSLGSWLAEAGVPALQGIDTRALTQHLRSIGTVDGRHPGPEQRRSAWTADRRRHRHGAGGKARRADRDPRVCSQRQDRAPHPGD
jgi:carbamoyl-phosphate synthase small subunit